MIFNIFYGIVYGHTNDRLKQFKILKRYKQNLKNFLLWDFGRL